MSSKWNREELLRRYLAGETYQDLGDEFGVTRERIRQVMQPSREQVKAAFAARRQAIIDMSFRHSDEINELAATGLSAQNVAIRLSLPRWFVTEFMSKHLSEEVKTKRYERSVKQMSESSRRWTEDDMVAAIKEVAGWLNVDCLSIDGYRVERDRDRHPSHASIVAIIGWNEACRRAGLEVNSTGAEGWGARHFTDEQVLSALERVTNELGHIPSSHEYANARREDEPSHGIIVRRVHEMHGNGESGWSLVRKLLRERI
jgi:hypothetical protein